MYIKSVFVALLFHIGSLAALAQEPQSILSAPENWESERFPFPLSFAPSIGFSGFEELRFSPGWSDRNSPEFWTYTFVWYIDKDSMLTENRLAEIFESYFDGLMRVDAGEPADSVRPEKTLAVFIKTGAGFQGKIRVHDAFFTKKTMTLFVRTRESFCPATNKQLIVCELSPKTFDDPTWGIFRNVRITLNCE